MKRNPHLNPGSTTVHPLLPKDGPKPILLLLEAVRTAVINTGLIVLPSAAGGYVAAGPVIKHLNRTTGVTLAAFSLPDAFVAYLTIALGIGVMISLPYFQFKILSVLPMMYPSVSTRDMFIFWLGSVLLFHFGAILNGRILCWASSQGRISLCSEETFSLGHGPHGKR